MNKKQALTDLKNMYVKVGDPLYMSIISTIKNHYENVLTVAEIRNFLAKNRTYTTHFQFKPVKYHAYYIRRLRQMVQADLTDVNKISNFSNNINFLLVCIDCIRYSSIYIST